MIGNPEGYSINLMWAANGAYLAMAIINWIFMWGKYFYYVWFGIGYDKALALIVALLA